MIKIKRFDFKLEEKYLDNRSDIIKNSLLSNRSSLNSWIESNLISLLIGYKNKEREWKDLILDSLDDLIKDFTKKFPHLLININLYDINNYFNKYLTTDKSSLLYNQIINVNEARLFLKPYETDYELEYNLFDKFLNDLENRSVDEKLSFQSSELNKIIINKAFKEEYKRHNTSIDKYSDRFKNVNSLQKQIDRFSNNPNTQNRLDSFLKNKELEHLKSIFDYDKFTSSKNLGRHHIISSLNISVCPYCNRQYITNYNDDKSINKTTADLDHYYPKSKYPFLALSLYNFIPSCQICNSRMKSDKEGHLYPYEEAFDNKAIFKTNETTADAILNSNKDKIKVSIQIQEDKFTEEEKNNGFKNRLEASIKDVFKLDKVYETSHNQYIYEMLHTIEKHPDSYLDSIAELFIEKNKNDNKEDNKISQVEKEKMKNYLKELVTKPYINRIKRGDTLSKLTEDILREFDLYK